MNNEPAVNLTPSDGDPPAHAGENRESLGATTRVANQEVDTSTLVGADQSDDVEITFRDPLVGGKIGKYEIRNLLGEGGMGSVYLAFDPLIEREVALKILAPAVSGNKSALQRFLGEARAIGRLNNPHVVSVYDIDQWDEQYYIVMELLSGGSVAERSESTGALPWKDACRIIAEAARGLASAHAAGMIHRDIKPENLMLTKEGTVKVVDFGLSKLVDAANDTRTAVTREGQILGTPQYMSPEQFETAEVDARSDIYSLGATLFRLLTGRFPYHDCKTILQVMAAHVNQPPPIPTKFTSNMPAECDRIVARAMAKKREERYQQVSEMADDLQQLIEGRGAPDRSAAVDQVRDLGSVLILEPSKLQGAVFKDAFSRAGTTSVTCLTKMVEARKAFERQPPDVLITALELSEGRGLDLLRELDQRDSLGRTTVVLHSSDSTIDELHSLKSDVCAILAPKTAKPDDLLRVIHAASALNVRRIAEDAGIERESVRVRIMIETPQIPAPLAELVRRANLLNVDVAHSGAESSEPFDLTLTVLPTSTDIRQTTPYAIAKRAHAQGLSAVIRVDGSHLTLLSVAGGGITALTRRELDDTRLQRLLHSCRP